MSKKPKETKQKPCKIEPKKIPKKASEQTSSQCGGGYLINKKLKQRARTTNFQ